MIPIIPMGEMGIMGIMGSVSSVSPWKNHPNCAIFIGLKINPQHIVFLHHFRRVLEAAAEEEIEVIPLKGIYLIAEIYPKNSDRGLMSDVDFLVKAREFDRMCKLLERLGFVFRGTEYPAIKENANFFKTIFSFFKKTRKNITL